MHARKLLATLAVAAISAAGMPSHAATMPIVATPASHETSTFGVDPVLADRGTTVEFYNLDPIALHNVRSVATDSVKRAWCTTTQANSGKCPKFHSGDVIPALDSSPVAGTAALAPGDYEFFCEPHPDTMRAVLRVS